MAIREHEVKGLLEGRPDAVVVSDGNGLAIDLGDHAGAVAKVRRNVLRRLVLADIVGLAIAAGLGALLVSAVSEDPNSAAGRIGAVMLFNVAVIPLFIGVFAVYSLYKGATRRISLSVFSDLRNILHALLVSGFLYSVVGYTVRRVYDFQAISVGKILSMCLVVSSDGPRWVRCRSSSSVPASWPRLWPATFGPTRACTS
jgi:hypothetical protein